jgi:hypothetical protein
MACRAEIVSTTLLLAHEKPLAFGSVRAMP